MNPTLRPLLGIAAAAFAAHASAQITFYEGEGFRGRTFAANGEVAQLRALRLQRPGVVGRRRPRTLGSLRRRTVPGPLRRAASRQLRLAARPGPGKPDLVGARVDDDAANDNEAPQRSRRPTTNTAAAPNERLREVPITSVRAVMGPPEQRCWVERSQVGERTDLNVPGAIIGGVLGGILGHQIGGGSGKTVATIGGAVGGGALGANIDRIRDPQSGQRSAALRERRRRSAAVLGRDLQLPGVEHRVQMTTPPGRPSPSTATASRASDRPGESPLQVITDGRSRPVRSLMPAIRSAIAISGASAACVSTACRAGSASKRSR